MRFQWFSGRYFVLRLFFFFFLYSSFFFYKSLSILDSFSSFFCSYRFLSFDYVGISFCFLSLFLLMALTLCSHILSSYPTFLILSLIFSFICYLSSKSLLFWISYELSILFLLLLLYLESPYSERFLASWYLLGYVVFTSLPMFMCILYLTVTQGTLNMSCWHVSGYDSSYATAGCIILLSVMFITKIPLLPFHVWLPIVHAEAPSPVSVCLRGYIMKLGVLGLYRFRWSLLSSDIFNIIYCFVILLIALFFFFSSFRELDGKRWLAFLSLAHIGLVSFFICYGDFISSKLPYYFCLGHGISAGCVFIILWLFYDLSSSRNWLVVKRSLFGGSLKMFFMLLGLFSAASIPPTITFFSEVFIIGSSVLKGFFPLLLFLLYLFFRGLVPLFLMGHLLGSSYSISILKKGLNYFYSTLFFIVIWIYSLFLFF